MGFTYSGHPIACAAALKNIEIIECEDICAGVRDVGAYFYEQALTLRDLPMVGDVRGSHFMVGIEYVADKQRKTPYDANVRVAERVFEACRKQGLIVCPLCELIAGTMPPDGVTDASFSIACDIGGARFAMA